MRHSSIDILSWVSWLSWHLTQFYYDHELTAKTSSINTNKLFKLSRVQQCWCISLWHYQIKRDKGRETLSWFWYVLNVICCGNISIWQVTRSWRPYLSSFPGPCLETQWRALPLMDPIIRDISRNVIHFPNLSFFSICRYYLYSSISLNTAQKYFVLLTAVSNGQVFPLTFDQTDQVIPKYG